MLLAEGGDQTLSDGGGQGLVLLLGLMEFLLGQTIELGCRGVVVVLSPALLVLSLVATTLSCQLTCNATKSASLCSTQSLTSRANSRYRRPARFQ